MRNRKTSVKWHFLGHMCVLANTLLENHLPTTLPYEPSQFYEQNHLVYREGLGVIACVWNIDEDVAGVKRDVLDSWKYRVTRHESYLCSNKILTLKIDFHWEHSLSLLRSF